MGGVLGNGGGRKTVRKGIQTDQIPVQWGGRLEEK